MENDRNQPVNARRLWFAVAAGPILWAVHLMASYALASLPCITTVFNFTVLNLPGIRFVLIVFTVVIALIVFLAGFIGYGIWQALRDDEGNEERTARPGATRVGFMAFSGILLSVLFGVAVLLTLGPILTLHVC